MFGIELPYGEVIYKNRETVKLYLSKSYRASECFKFLPYLHHVEIFKLLSTTSLTIGMTFEIIYLQLEILVKAYSKNRWLQTANLMVQLYTSRVRYKR